MVKKIYCTNSGLEMDSDLKKFLERAINRLGGDIKIYIRDTKNSDMLREAPDCIVTSFEHDLFKCDFITDKPGRKNVRCNFPRLAIEADCPYCGNSKTQKMIATV